MKTSLPKKSKITVAVGFLVVFASLVYFIFVYVLFQKSHDILREYSQQETVINKALSNIHKNIGYGGFIHDFKNLVLRRDANRYGTKIDVSIEELTKSISALDVYLISSEERRALKQIRDTFFEYEQKYKLALDLIEAGKSSSEIDAAVYVSDANALIALETISSSFNKRVSEVNNQFESQKLQEIRWLIIGGITLLIVIVAGVLQLIRSNTQILLVNKDLKKSILDAQYANNAKSRFLSSMSHELRTPMNAIIGFSQLLMFDAKSESEKENINEVIQAGEHLLQLINDVLDLSRIESGTLVLYIGRHNLNNIVTSCLLKVMPIADARSIKIDNRIDALSRIDVDVDQVRFRQVIINLLSNAIKYNVDNGTVVIDVSVIEEHTLYLSITDTGKGLSTEQQKHLFSPFDRIGYENSHVKGTGLGLVIAKDLIEKMNGKIGFDSEEGKGSRVWIHVPLTSKNT